MLSRFMQRSLLMGLKKMVCLQGVAFTRNPGHEYNRAPKPLRMIVF